MKKVILLALVGLAGWQIYSEHNVPTITNADLALLNTPTESRFSCDGRQHCSQMTSRAEAVYFTKNCPNTKMDGDNDGIPCENDSRF